MNRPGRLVAANSLSERDIERMLRLMLSHYDGVNKEKFRSDLNRKNGAIIVRDNDGFISGFSTYRIDEITFDGKPYRVLYSGDTVVDESGRGSYGLFKGFAELITPMLNSPDDNVYWFLISKGIRTYLMLPLFFRSFYPNPDSPTPSFEAGLINHIAAYKFESEYDKRSGIIRIDPPGYRLTTEYAGLTEKEQQNDYVRFFIEANPEFASGEELACLARVQRDNITRAGMKLIDRL